MQHHHLQQQHHHLQQQHHHLQQQHHHLQQHHLQQHHLQQHHLQLHHHLQWGSRDPQKSKVTYSTTVQPPCPSPVLWSRQVTPIWPTLEFSMLSVLRSALCEGVCCAQHYAKVCAALSIMRRCVLRSALCEGECCAQHCAEVSAALSIVLSKFLQNSQKSSPLNSTHETMAHQRGYVRRCPETTALSSRTSSSGDNILVHEISSFTFTD
ncbi:hypothetical protein FHG87_018819 [Trinorchestia longiramus]|nr:hypothetical protein FHG87_018819 [Trinorchestia longiramus]